MKILFWVFVLNVCVSTWKKEFFLVHLWQQYTHSNFNINFHIKHFVFICIIKENIWYRDLVGVRNNIVTTTKYGYHTGTVEPSLHEMTHLNQLLLKHFVHWLKPVNKCSWSCTDCYQYAFYLTMRTITSLAKKKNPVVTKPSLGVNSLVAASFTFSFYFIIFIFLKRFIVRFCLVFAC